MAVGGFDHQHFQHALTLHLQNQRAGFFQIAREQGAGGQEFAQRAADGGRIVLAPDNVLPNAVEPDMGAAHRHIVENKTGSDVVFGSVHDGSNVCRAGDMGLGSLKIKPSAAANAPR